MHGMECDMPKEMNELMKQPEIEPQMNTDGKDQASICIDLFY